MPSYASISNKISGVPGGATLTHRSHNLDRSYTLLTADLLALPLPCAFFFFNDTATTEISTLSLHDALPTSGSIHVDVTPIADAPNLDLNSGSVGDQHTATHAG